MFVWSKTQRSSCVIRPLSYYFHQILCDHEGEKTTSNNIRKGLGQIEVTNLNWSTHMHTGLEKKKDAVNSDRPGICEGVVFLQTARRDRLGHLRHWRILLDGENSELLKGGNTTDTRCKGCTFLISEESADYWLHELWLAGIVERTLEASFNVLIMWQKPSRATASSLGPYPTYNHGSTHAPFWGFTWLAQVLNGAKAWGQAAFKCTVTFTIERVSNVHNLMIGGFFFKKRKKVQNITDQQLCQIYYSFC